MHLEQLNLTYLPQEDRIVMRIGFGSVQEKNADTSEILKQEVQVYITRRLLSLLWPAILEVMEAHVRMNRPEAAFASNDLMQMDHQASLDDFKEKGSFDQQYDEQDRTGVHGATPLLIESVKFHLTVNEPICMQIILLQGDSIELKMDKSLMHGFCKLLQKTEGAAQWGLDLKLLGQNETLLPAHKLN